jgi:glycosyltransferase involved in cell wall biosynthesis
MRDPQVSVVIPTRDRRRLLAETLGSVLRQRGVDLEVVLVDEASTDADAVAYLAAAAEQPGIRVVRHEQARGVAEAYNAGIRNARAPWVAFCDDDDLWAPDKLERQLAALAAAPDAEWCCTGAVDIDSEDKRILGWQAPPRAQDVHRRLLTEYVIPAARSTVVVARARLEEVGEFHTRLAHTDDWDMWVRLAAVTPLATVDAPLAGYRRHRASMMHTGFRGSGATALFAQEHAETRARLGLEFPYETDQLRKSAFLALESGHRVAAARNYLRQSLAERRPKLAAVGLAALLSPRRTLEHHRGRLLREAPEGYLEAARAWLSQLEPAEWSA